MRSPAHRRTNTNRRGRRLGVALLVAAATLAGVGTTGAVADATARTGSDYYVACGVKAVSGDGTSAHPWPSLGAAQQHGAFGAGDRILLKRGTACHGRFAGSGSGTAAAPITLGAYGRGAKPTIAAGGSPNGTAAVQLVDVAYWIVQDLHITNTTGKWNPSVYRAGVLFRSTTTTREHGLVAQRLSVDHVDSNPGGGDARSWGGIVARTESSGAGFTDMLIRNNRVIGVGRTGIIAANIAYRKTPDRGLRITGNVLHWVRGDSIVVLGVHGGRIDHNVSAHGSNLSKCSAKQCGRMGGPSTATAAIWPVASSDIRIDHNEVYGEHKAAGDGSGIDIDLYSTRITVEQNYIHDNQRGGIMFCGARSTVVRFNVLQGNGESAFRFTCGWRKDQTVKNITIANNDVVNGSSAKWVVRNVHPNPGSTIHFTNNLVFCAGSCVYSWPTRPVAASNSYIGTRSSSEPVGTGTRHTAPGLRSAGSGKLGFGSLGGYRLREGVVAPHGVELSSTAYDIFDRRVNAKKPVRGASVT